MKGYALLLLSAVCIAIAGYLCLLGQPGWGWFLVMGLMVLPAGASRPVVQCRHDDEEDEDAGS